MERPQQHNLFPRLGQQALGKAQCDIDDWNWGRRPGLRFSPAKSGAHIASAIGFYREMLGVVSLDGETHTTHTTWTDTPKANEQNAGYRYFSWNAGALDVACHTFWREKPLSCFLDWGFCMWDQSRLEAWKLLDLPKGYDSYWADPRKCDRHGCVHCIYPPRSTKRVEY